MTPPERAAILAAAGPASGKNIIGETTESLHKFLVDGYNLGGQPPRLEEDLKFVPKDREEVIYIYMYRLAQNQTMLNSKRHRQAPVFTKTDAEQGEVYYHRPPLLLDLYYLVAVHSKFRSDAERLMGWLLVRLNEATHLIHRPRRFALPDGREVDSLGRTYDVANFSAPAPDATEDDKPADDGLLVEKVSLALTDDLTVGDAINLFTLHEAPYRPFLTYRARVALDGPLYKSAGGSTVRMGRLEPVSPPADGPGQSRNGRIRPGMPLPKPRSPPGPPPHFVRKIADTDSDSED
ncbi:hypothetical protein LBMAG42_25720 [Deltaproteobacteria bacterium]|nr:hypothetical protein LBMAG42_25720 [Deltaproteobacteria bacterium]